MGEKIQQSMVAELKTTDAFKQVAKFLPCLQTLGPVDRRKPFSLTQRAGTVGPISVVDLAFSVDACISCPTTGRSTKSIFWRPDKCSYFSGAPRLPMRPALPIFACLKGSCAFLAGRRAAG